MSFPDRTKAAHTQRGFEVIEPVPGFLRKGLLAVALFLAVPILSILLDGAIGDVAARFAYVFGKTSLIAGIILLGVLLWFDRHSNFLFRFERDRLLRLFRVGPVTIWRSEWSPASLEACELLLDCTPRALKLHFTDCDDASIHFPDADANEVRVVISEIEVWRADPRSMPVAREAVSPMVLLAETAVAGLLVRLKSAPAVLVVGVALLMVGNGVHRMQDPGQQAPENRAVGGDRREVPGDLVRFRILVRSPNAEERTLGHRDGKAWIEFGVHFQDESGKAHTQWWRTSDEIDLWSLPAMRLWPIARSIGLPWLEFQTPEEGASAWRNAEGELDWREIDRRPTGNDALLESQRNLVRFADQPIENLALLHFAVAPDWTMTYLRNDPASATLRRFAEREQALSRAIPRGLLIAMVVLGAILAVLVAATWLARRRHGLVALVMFVIVAASPFWARYSAQIPVWLGLEADLAESIAAVLRTAAPLSVREHEYLVPLAEPTPERSDLLMRWTPETARSGELLQTLALDHSPLDADPVDFGRNAHDDALKLATQALLAPVHRRILAMDDAQLIAFLKRLHEGRHDRFNALLVVMPDCELAAQSERAENTREWINAVLHPDCVPRNQP